MGGFLSKPDFDIRKEVNGLFFYVKGNSCF